MTLLNRNWTLSHPCVNPGDTDLLRWNSTKWPFITLHRAEPCQQDPDLHNSGDRMHSASHTLSVPEAGSDQQTGFEPRQSKEFLSHQTLQTVLASGPLSSTHVGQMATKHWGIVLPSGGWLRTSYLPSLGLNLPICKVAAWNRSTSAMYQVPSSRGWLFATPWTVAYQAPLSPVFSRQEYWRELPCPSPGDLPDPGIKPMSPAAPALQVGSLPLSHCGRPEAGPSQPKNTVILGIPWWSSG